MAAADGRRPRRRMATVVSALPALALVGGVLTSCGSHGAPSCTDTGASGARLAKGCTLHGKTFPAHATKCVDHRTLYNVPYQGTHGASSSYSNGKLRTRGLTVQELAACLGQ